jgi:hypothetical protein
VDRNTLKEYKIENEMMNQLVLPGGDLEVEDRREFELLGAARVPRVPRAMECRGLIGEALPTKSIDRF